MNKKDFRIESTILTGYFGDRTIDVLTVPEEVKALRKYCLSNIDCKEINLPSSVSFLNPSLIYNCTFLEKVNVGKDASIINPLFLEDCPNVKEITVSEENKDFTSVDGFVLTKDKTKLIMCPVGKSGKVVLPEGIKTLDLSLFLDCKKITSLVLPSSVEEVNLVNLSENKELKEIVLGENVSSMNEDFLNPNSNHTRGYYKGVPRIIVPEENDFYKVFDGALYNFVENRLVYVSDEKENDLVIPPFITKINYGVLHNKNITGITVPNGTTFDEEDKEPFKESNNIIKVDCKNRHFKIDPSWFSNCSIPDPNNDGEEIYQFDYILKNVYPGQMASDRNAHFKDTVTNYIIHDKEVTEEWKKSWVTYFIDNIETYGKKVMERTTVLRTVLKFNKLDLNQIQQLLSVSRNSEASNLLLQYKKENYGFTTLIDQLEDEICKVTNDL